MQPRILAVDGIKAHILGMPESGLRSELAKYLPIAVIACLETAFRLGVRDLIDRSPDARRRLVGFRDLKFGVEQVADIHTGSMTLGEFVAHILPCNDLDDIAGSLSKLADDDILRRTLAVPIDTDTPGHTVSIETMGHSAAILQAVRQLFVLRHLYCHEAAPGHQVDLREIAAIVGWGNLFTSLLTLAITQDADE